MINLTKKDFEILPATQAECNDFADVYVLVVDTHLPARIFLPNNKTEWLPKDGATEIVQQILENQEKAEKYDKLVYEIQDQPHDGICNVVVNTVLQQENRELRESLNTARNTIGEHYRGWEKLKKIVDDITVASNLWSEPHATALKKLLEGKK